MQKVRVKLAVFLVRLIGHLPFSGIRLLGSLLGSLAYHANTSMARVTHKNLSICFPYLGDFERRRLSLRSLQETGKTAAETCYVWQQPSERTLALIETSEGEEHVQAALAAGRGLLVLAPHLGNWEVLGFHLVRFAQVTNLYQPPKLAGFDAMIQASRTKCGSRLAPTNAKGIATLLKQLKANAICGILPDQTPKEASSGDFADFFGEPAFTMTLVHKLIQRTQCQAVFAYAKRTSKGFRVIYRPASEGIYSCDQHESLLSLNADIEELVREAPEQYQWEYKRFKKYNQQRPVKHYA